MNLDADALETNQRALLNALAEVRGHLKTHLAAEQKETAVTELEDESSAVASEPPAAGSGAHQEQSGSTETAAAPKTESALENTALDAVVRRFSLSPFERLVLLLCAGAEFDGSIAALIGQAHGNPAQQQPSFGLALAALPGAHWSALAPVAALRRWCLVQLEDGGGVTSSPLRISERILHYLAGIAYFEPRLQGMLERVDAAPGLAPAHIAIARRIVQTWGDAQGVRTCPAMELTGGDPAGAQAIAAISANTLGFRLYRLRASDLPHNSEDRVSLARLWEREAMLTGGALLVAVDPDCGEDVLARARAFVMELDGLTAVTAPASLGLKQRLVLEFNVERPGAADQLALWQRELGPRAVQLNGAVERVAGQFHLDTTSIRAAAQEALSRPDGDPGAGLWNACRRQARPSLDGLAQRIEPTATWDALVLPPAQKHILRTIVAQVRQRARVCEDWGFARQGTRGLGIHALFVGPSGTGKTMAAEVMARELELDLHRIDLSALVSKYIGETEKNLRRVFDAAERGGSILLFDEADALFGKRSEVKDSHDRYANIEVSYLLQRLESYRGLAILTTNLKSALDTAFTRRLRFTVHFAFPDQAHRMEIWRRVFPKETPTDGLNFAKLSRLSLAGGHIRNLALNAAFLAADANEPVRMPHLLAAAQAEYAKLEKPLSDAEIAGWL